ncbi:MAG TPA: hypothetical protein P5119_00775 [Candidatus Aminicenantes bacterium]|nr:hypothetical protein [Candidatus Aminicenantes bacterium]HRY63857.1 hypothetical protein [Candidatus Aminicenantes bacterium]HRZ70770.1 hypothetical protein [Candidatus Aminicenantes bacterium]
MKKALRKTLRISGLVAGVLVLLLAAAALLAVFDKPLVRNIVEHRLGRGAGSTARIGRLDYRLFPFRVSAESVEIGREDRFQKLVIGLARLEAKGAFWKLVRGLKPALDSIEVDGLTVRLEQKAASEAPVDVPGVLLQVSDTLAWAGRISLTGARLSLGLPAGRTEIEDLDLALTPGPGRDAVAYSIGRGRVRRTDPAGVPTLAADLASAGRLILASPYLVDGAFTLTSVSFPPAGPEARFETVTLALTARLDRPNQELNVTTLKAAIPGLIDIRGRCVGKSIYGIFLEAEAEVGLTDLAAAARILGPRLPAWLRQADPSGRALLSGTYVLQRSDKGSKDSLAASLSLEDAGLTAVIGGRPVRVKAAGRIDAAGPSADPRLSVDLRSSLGRFAVSGLSAAGAGLHLVGAGSKTAAGITRLDVRLTGLDYLTAGGRRLAFSAADLSARGTIDLARGSGVLTSLEARLPGLAPVRISGRGGWGPRAAAELRLESRGLDLPALRAAAAPFLPPALAGWDLGGALDLSLAARRPAGPDRDWTFSGRLAFASARFNDPSFTIAGEGLDPVLAFEGAGSPARGLTFSAGLDIAHGESLWKAVYVAWDKHALRLTAGGRYDPAAGAIDGLSARVLLPEIGALDIAGSARLGPVLSFDLKAAADVSLGPLYSLYSQAGVAAESRMKLAGRMTAALDVRANGGALSLGGRVRLADANIDRPAGGLALIGISADVPLLYESGPAASGLAPAPAPDRPLSETGFFRIGELRQASLSLKNVAIALRGGPNALGLEPFGLDLYGGRLELGRTTFRFDPASGSFRGAGSLALRGLDISRFPVASPQFKLTGKIEADFPRLDIGPDKIAVSGRGEASVFGGKVVLRDLAVADPFAAGRSISLNIDLVDLDMKKLTDEVPFGEVTGIVRGEVRDLVLSYGQPERFVFRIESVPRRGVPQTFSLKAVDNLTVLSSGEKASGGTGGFWMKFIRGFRYQKLGIVSTLRNDTFTLNGTIHEGGVEYLVKKPPLFGINVVNREPGKKISFKEMTSRLKRVG